MKKLATFALALTLAILSLTVLAPTEAGASYCTSIPPFTAAHAGECFDLCVINYDCGIDRYEESTGCCYCGYKF